MSQLNQLHQLAQQALNHGDISRAQQALIQILNTDQSFYDAYFLLGIIEAELGQYNKAVSLIEKALSFRETAEYFAQLAKCYAMLGRGNDTHQAIQRAERFSKKGALTLDTLGVALSRLGEHKIAINYFEQAISLKQQASFYYNLGTSQTFSGLFEQARSSYESAIKLEPLFHQAHSSLSHLGGITEDNNHVERLESVLSKVQHPDAKLHISHALNRELDALQRYEEAFNYLHNAKQAKLAKLNYDFAQDKHLFQSIKELFSDSSSELKGHSVFSDAAPVFVVGMPRSGTTLIERVITNNTDIKSAGELQEFGLALKQLSKTSGRYVIDPETAKATLNIDMAELGNLYINSLSRTIQTQQRFVDKMPLNVLYAGWIAKALPNAKIVCVIRNPMDTVWGNYKQMFSLNDPYYNYAFDQVSTAKFYSEFVALAEYWQALFPEQFTIVRYDEFVKNPEPISKVLCQFLDISWQPSILDITKNDSAVATASSVQVRSAINTKSLGNWRKYESKLKPAVTWFNENGIDIPV